MPIGRAVDRIAAAAVAGGLSVSLAVAVLVTPSPDPRVEDAHRAARELVALTRGGEHATYVGRYVETLVRADGGRLPSTTYVARRKQVLATRSGTSLHVYLPDRSYACELAGTTPSCFDQPPAGLPESEVLRVAVASGAYDVARAEGAQIAGEEAECFTMKAHGVNKRLPQFGAETDVCLASDGVPLRKRVYSDRLDALEAQHVDRRFDDGTLAPVLGGFEQAAPPTRR